MAFLAICVWSLSADVSFTGSAVLALAVFTIGISTLRVHIGQTRLSTSDFHFSARSYAASARRLFVFGILVRRPFAVLCDSRIMDVHPTSFSALSFIRELSPRLRPKVFRVILSRLLGAQLFFLVYCIVEFQPPPKTSIAAYGRKPLERFLHQGFHTHRWQAVHREMLLAASPPRDLIDFPESGLGLFDGAPANLFERPSATRWRW